MLPPPQSPKRKNDEPNNHRLLPLLLLLIAVGAIGLLWWRHSQRITDFPATPLLYIDKDLALISFNLQTGEKKELPAFDTYSGLTANFSPDDKWRAYWEEVDQGGGILFKLYVETLDRSEQKSLGSRFNITDFISWSSDSQWIAFSAQPKPDNESYNTGDEDQRGQREEIYLWNIYTHEEKRLTENTFADRFPSISPDGTKIAYTSDADGVNRLYIMDIATQESRLLTPERDGYKPIWAPDGRWLAFISNCQPALSSEYLCNGADLWLIRADGTGAQSIQVGTGMVEALWLP